MNVIGIPVATMTAKLVVFKTITIGASAFIRGLWMAGPRRFKRGCRIRTQKVRLPAKYMLKITCNILNVVYINTSLALQISIRPKRAPPTTCQRFQCPFMGYILPKHTITR
jgi:hypothetical protein